MRRTAAVSWQPEEHHRAVARSEEELCRTAAGKQVVAGYRMEVEQPAAGASRTAGSLAAAGLEAGPGCRQQLPKAGAVTSMCRHTAEAAAVKPEEEHTTGSLAGAARRCSAGRMGPGSSAAVHRPRCSCWTWPPTADPGPEAAADEVAGHSTTATVAAGIGRTVAEEVVRMEAAAAGRKHRQEEGAPVRIAVGMPWSNVARE